MESKYNTRTLIIILISLFLIPSMFSQETSPDFQFEPRVKSVVIKNDNTEYVGYILNRDAREILIDTEELGDIYIPLHEIKSIIELEAGQEYSGGELFGTRYFINTNGLALKKGEGYALFNWWGPEIQFNVDDNFSVGAMTSWVASPLIGSLKFSIPAGEMLSFGIGTLIGTGLWAGGIGGLAYGTVTYGDYANNVTLTGGYAGIGYQGETGSAPLLSLSCLSRVGKNFSFVGDSFIYLGANEQAALIIPGLRYSKANTRAFQFGLAGLVAGGQTSPIPIPIISFFRAF